MDVLYLNYISELDSDEIRCSFRVSAEVMNTDVNQYFADGEDGNELISYSVSRSPSAIRQRIRYHISS